MQGVVTTIPVILTPILHLVSAQYSEKQGSYGRVPMSACPGENGNIDTAYQGSLSAGNTHGQTLVYIHMRTCHCDAYSTLSACPCCMKVNLHRQCQLCHVTLCA